MISRIDHKSNANAAWYARHGTSSCDLDLWPIDPKINRLLSQAMLNDYIRFNQNLSIHTWVSIRKWICGQTVSMTLTFELLTPKLIGFFLRPCLMKTCSLIKICPFTLELSSGNEIDVTSSCDLDLWPSDRKINRVLPSVLCHRYMKLESNWTIQTWVIVRKRNLCKFILWPWPLTFWPQNQ